MLGLSPDRSGRSLGHVPLGPLPASPLISVIVASYNYADYVAEAIESVLCQTYRHFEIIVCDDGSLDNSVEVVRSYAQNDNRVKLLRKQNGGQASAWNAAFYQSKGDILCLLDADDMFEPEKLEQVVDYFGRHLDCGFVIHPLMVVDQWGEDVQRIPYLTRLEEGWIADRICRRGGRWRALPSSGLSMRREFESYVCPIPEAPFRYCADAFVFTLLPILTPVGALPEILGRYRIHQGNGYGVFERDLVATRKEIESISQSIEAVNQRLEELGLANVTLDIRRNLFVQELHFRFSLMSGCSRLLGIRTYLLLGRNLIRDDLYGVRQKVLGLVVYGVALMLPVSLLAWWFTKTLGYTTTKQRAFAVARRLRAPRLVQQRPPR